MKNSSSTSEKANQAHVGIVACSAEGAALCYRTLCVEGAELFGRHCHPQVSLHGYCLDQYMEFIRIGNWDEVAHLMLSSAQKLHLIGADFLICPDNTIHQALPLLEQNSPLPWLHIAQVVGQEAKRAGHCRLGVMGTKYLMEGPVYNDELAKLGIEALVPAKNDRIRIDEVIFDELVNGVYSEASRNYFYGIISQFKEKGCTAVILGCTEIPLLVQAEESPLPVLDSTRLLARAALKRSYN